MGKIRKWLAVLGTGVCLLAATPDMRVYAETEPTYQITEETEMAEPKIGVVNVSELNVRTGFGGGYDQVKVNGKLVILHSGDKVAVFSIGKSTSGYDWYEVRWMEDGVEYHGYVRGLYVDISEERAMPLATPTPLMTPTPEPTPTPEATPTPLVTPTPLATPTTIPEPMEESGFSVWKGIGLVVLFLFAAAVVYAVILLKKREAAGAETSEKIDSLKNIQIKKGLEETNGKPAHTLKRKPEVTEETQEKTVRQKSKGYESDAAILARKEHARMINEEIMEKSRFYDPNEEKKKEDELKHLSESLKEKELLREEIENLSPGDLVYHEYFGKGVVFDNSDVKRIEIRFGTDVRFVDKSACVAKKLMRKV